MAVENLSTLFIDIGLIIIVGTIFGFLAKMLKQPLIPSYVLAGLLLGPILQIITHRGVIDILSEMGIAFLLFIVGLELNVSKLKNVGMVASVGGALQCAILFGIGFVIMMIAGFKYVEAIYIGMIIAFSSTMVVIKILSDKRELDTLHGRIIIGYLLMQDFLAIMALSLLGNLNDLTMWLFFVSLGKAFLLCFFSWFLSKYILPTIFKYSAAVQELLFLTAVSTCFLFSFLSAEVLGFSVAIGAFIGGVSLANLPYSYEIIGKVKSIRDFFSTIFFVSLGMSIVSITKSMILILVLLLIATLLLKPIIILFITAIFGYKARPAFLTSISLAQTSEFSLILATQGLILGHISQEIFSITALLAVLTMTLTSYLMKYEYWFYDLFKGVFGKFDLFTSGKDHEFLNEKSKYDVLLIGYDRIGYSIVKKLHLLKKKLLVVDFNPEIIKRLIKEKIHCLYGDISDIEILERINLKQMAMVISTSPNKQDNLLLIKKTKEVNKKALIFLTAYKVEDALELYGQKADYVILPHFLGGEHVSLLIESFGDDMDKVIKHRYAHIEELKKRQTLGHSHPAQHHHQASEE